MWRNPMGLNTFPRHCISKHKYYLLRPSFIYQDWLDCALTKGIVCVLDWEWFRKTVVRSWRYRLLPRKNWHSQPCPFLSAIPALLTLPGLGHYFGDLRVPSSGDIWHYSGMHMIIQAYGHTTTVMYPVVVDDRESNQVRATSCQW